MKRWRLVGDLVTWLLMALALLAIATLGRADVTETMQQTPTLGGLRGVHLDSPSADALPHGLVFDMDGLFCWGQGLDATRNYPGTPDLVLAYSKDTNADNLRMRSDDARTALGPVVGHPILPLQLSIEPGPAHGGIAVGTYNYQYSIYLYNRGPSKRTNLNFFNLFGWLTDTASNGSGDLGLYNYQSASYALRFSPSGGMGFYGSAPVARPVVTGSWAAGTAQKSVLAALVALGLAQDLTTE